jgi:hypothetical protein
MQQTKIQLLPAEIALVSSPDFILTKNAILQKVKLFLEEIQLKQADQLNQYKTRLPKEVLKISPKISRGENYKGLPWLVLDHPRHFQPGIFFAIRTMFWWGNFFSITLHVSGIYKDPVLKNIISNYSLLAENNFYFFTSDDEWEHDLNSGNYTTLKSTNIPDAEKILSEKKFLKLGIKFPVEKLESVEENLTRNFTLLVKCIC